MILAITRTHRKVTVKKRFVKIRKVESTMTLGGGFKHGLYFPFHIWDVILPIDELHHFSRWFSNHQPVTNHY